MLDSKLVIVVNTAELAVAMLFAVFFIFNIEYSSKVANIMEFMER